MAQSESTYSSQQGVDGDSHVDTRKRIPFFASYAGFLMVVGICFSVGIAYVVAQWIIKSAISDAAFVSLLLASTIVLLLGMRHLYRFIGRRGRDFYSFLAETEEPETALNDHSRLTASVFRGSLMILVGILYGGVISAAPFMLDVWKGEPLLRWLLVTYMFLVNFATGAALYSLVSFFKHSTRLGRMAKVDLWHVDNPSTKFILGATRRISLLASLYVCLSLSSIVYSELPLSWLVYSYGGFSCLVILSSLVIPSFPIASKIRDAKAQTLHEVESQIHLAFDRMISAIKSGQDEVDDSRFQSMLELRDRIEAIQTWPFRIKAAATGFSVVVFSAIPIVLEILLERAADKLG